MVWLIGWTDGYVARLSRQIITRTMITVELTRCPRMQAEGLRLDMLLIYQVKAAKDLKPT